MNKPTRIGNGWACRNGHLHTNAHNAKVCDLDPARDDLICLRCGLISVPGGLPISATELERRLQEHICKPQTTT